MRRFVFLFACCGAFFPGSAGAQRSDILPCAPENALAAEIQALDEQGIFTLKEGYRLRLAQIVWPDHLEAASRQALVARLWASLQGQIITWKPAAGPDRWGVTPAHFFIRESVDGPPAFWLQAGLAEAGLAPVWPSPVSGACFATLERHEAEAIRARRGYWAPRAQTARHRAIEAAREDHAGRKIAGLWRVRSIRAWRTMHFVNFMPSFRGGPSLGLTRKQMTQLGEAGRDPTAWKGKRLIARFIVGGAGLSRLRVETIDHIGLVD